MGTWPGHPTAITLFVEDLEATKRFYAEVFEQSVVFEDANSAVFRCGETLVNLLHTPAVSELISPAAMAPAEAGARFVLTLGVDDVDARCERLRSLGVELLNGPVDRPWGVRTATFRDPAGHIWEIAQ